MSSRCPDEQNGDRKLTDDHLVVVEGGSKKSCRPLRKSLRYGLEDIGRELLGRGLRDTLRPFEFWALREVSFELRRGECLAVIGPNGAGKSTLVKMLDGRIRPDGGRVTVRGRLNAIRELGIGFNPLLSGRENIRTNAALLGMSPRQTTGLLDRIIDFAGLREHIDAPVLTYSSGMKARLGYAVAAHLEPDVLLVDEVLAVGDVDFKRKCIRHIRRFLSKGGSLVLVSHDLFTVQTLCSNALYLESGRVAFSGPTTEALGLYLESRHRETGAESTTAGETVAGAGDRTPDKDQPMVIESVEISAPDGGKPRTAAPARVVVRYRSSIERSGVPWGFQICSGDLLMQVAVGIGALENDGQNLIAGRGELGCLIPSLPLLPGTYGLRAGVTEPGSRDLLALYGYDQPASIFRVIAPVSELDNLLRTSGSLTILETRPDAASDP